MKNQDDLINNHYDSHLTAPNDAVGGNYQKWKLEITRLSQRYVNVNIPPVEEFIFLPQNYNFKTTNHL